MIILIGNQKGSKPEMPYTKESHLPKRPNPKWYLVNIIHTT